VALVNEKNEVERELQRHFDVYESRVDQLVRYIFQSKVKPFCKARKWRFLTGNGSWGFFPAADAPRGAETVHPDDAEWETLRELLSTDPPGFPGSDLGSMMPNCVDYGYMEEV